MSHFFRLKLGTGNGRLNKPATAVLGLLLLCPPAMLADDAGVQTQAPAGVQERDGGLADVPV
ncbi:MAG: hypothetical protein K0U66_02455 [Gammaproteobacteria bacterium]|nr:hypothetical protein [Gammaproteobacteria bacterium]